MQILRTCIATRLIKDKRELFRIVKTKDNVVIDMDNCIQGRGAYISKNKEAILLAQKKKALQKALRCNIGDEIYNDLLILLEGGENNGKK